MAGEVHRRRTRLLTAYVLAVCALLMRAAQASAEPVRVVALSIEAGPKGAALVITADSDFPSPATVDVKVLSTATSLVAVRLEGAVYDLGVHRFTELPQQTPITELSAREREDYESIDVVMEAHVSPDSPLPVKTKGERVVVLLSREAFPTVSWKAPAPVLRTAESPRNESQPEWAEERPAGDETGEQAASADETVALEPHETAVAVKTDRAAPAAETREQQEPAPEPQPSELVRLERVEAVQRGTIAMLRFRFTGESTPIARRENGRVVLLFPRAANGKGQPRLEPPGDLFFKTIELRQRSRRNTEWLGAIVTLDDDDAAVYVHTDGNATTLTTSPMTSERFAYWSSDRDEYTLAAFTDIDDMPVGEAEPADTPHRVVSETTPAAEHPGRDEGEASVDHQAGAVVSAQPDSTPAAAEPEPASEDVQDYLVVVGDNVNVRSSASTEDGENVVGSLGRGMTVALLEKRGTWVRVRTPDAQVGWVYGALLSERTDEPAEEEKAVLAAHDAGTKGAAKPKAATMFPVDAVGALTSIGADESTAGAGDEVGGAAAAPAVMHPAVGPATAREEAPPLPNVVQYTTYGRDPFVPYSRKIDEGLPSVENLRLVGILYDRTDRIALLQDELFEDKAYAMREQDQINNGTVWRINPTNVIFLITELGISRTYTLELPSVSPTTVQEKRG